jgi:hypothetical protein
MRSNNDSRLLKFCELVILLEKLQVVTLQYNKNSWEWAHPADAIPVMSSAFGTYFYRVVAYGEPKEIL